MFIHLQYIQGWKQDTRSESILEHGLVRRNGFSSCPKKILVKHHSLHKIWNVHLGIHQVAPAAVYGAALAWRLAPNPQQLDGLEWKIHENPTNNMYIYIRNYSVYIHIYI